MINVEQDKNLAPWTTMGVGGTADYFVEVFDEAGISQAVDFANQNNLEIFVMGGGSNILVSDEGFKGLVILNRIKGYDIDEKSGIVAAGAGEDWDDVAAACVEKNLAGIECLSGVPGTVGGAVVQNIGAYGQTLGDIVQKVKVFNLKTLKPEELSAEECEFSYRSSLFKANQNNYVINYVIMKLEPNGSPDISYQDLADKFQSGNPALAEIRNAVIDIRAGKGMLIREGVEIYQSVGSFFKNPVIEKMHFDKMYPDLSDKQPAKTWHWQTKDGRIKVSAAFLIGQAGFPKGFKEGNVGISPKQNLAIINLGGATASEIRNFAQKIKQQVYERFGVELLEEVVYVGPFN